MTKMIVPLALLLLSFLASCGENKTSNPVSSDAFTSDKPLGTLILKINVEPWRPLLMKRVAVEAMDSVKAFVYTSTGSKVTEKKFIQSGAQWQGSMTLPAQNGLRIVLGYFNDNTVRYLGEKIGVNIPAGESVTVDISINYMGLSVIAPDSSGNDFVVKWTKRPSATSYQLQQDTKSDFSTAIQIYSGVDTTYTVPISGKTNGQTYFFRARAKTSYGYGPWYSKGSASTVGSPQGTIIITTPDLPDEAGGYTVIQGIAFKSIPAGSFTKGRTITLSTYDMSVYEITQGQYKSVIGSNPSYFTGDDNLPVEQITWFMAIKFCNALSVKAGLQQCYTNETTGECDFTKNGFRLPTEAEWEYACRAGSKTTYYLGNSENDLARAGWYVSNSSSKTHPVGQKTPNAWGLYDMLGNVWEWTNDWYGSYPAMSQANPTGPSSGSYRVDRGGCWGLNSSYSTSDKRGWLEPTGKDLNGYVGFRIVRRYQ